MWLNMNNNSLKFKVTWNKNKKKQEYWRYEKGYRNEIAFLVSFRIFHLHLFVSINVLKNLNQRYAALKQLIPEGDAIFLCQQMTP